MAIPLLLHGQREKTFTTKRMGSSEEKTKDNPRSTALSLDGSTNIIERPTMPSPPSLIPCIIPTVIDAEGYDDDTSETNFVIKMQCPKPFASFEEHWPRISNEEEVQNL